MKPLFRVAVPSLQMRGWSEDNLDLRQTVASLTYTRPGPGVRVLERKRVLLWWVFNDVQAASAELEWRAVYQLDSSLADRGHAGLCPPCYASSALPSTQVEGWRDGLVDKNVV